LSAELKPLKVDSGQSATAKGHPRPKQVLVAHQSTIPHYRAAFYSLIESMRPADWEFKVVFDPDPARTTAFHGKAASPEFPVLPVKTRIFHAGGRDLLWQNFLSAARRCDLLITDSHLANVSYPIASLVLRQGASHVIWGHSADLNHEVQGLAKKAAEKVKRKLLLNADGFFAYTPGEALRIAEAGFRSDRIFTMNNTIDICNHRRRWETLQPDRQQIQQDRGLEARRVILFVGRVLPQKGIGLLCDIFRELHHIDPTFHLVAIGSGPDAGTLKTLQHELGSEAVTLPGAIHDPAEIAPWFAAADVFLMPSDVGLAPLQGFCFDLPTVTFRGRKGGPEIEYLSASNTLFIENGRSAAAAAITINAQWGHLSDPIFRSAIFPSISHLTLEQMAQNIINAVTAMLALGPCK
jgi:glycosyltransferase involved in cell wall biosynthesis